MVTELPILLDRSTGEPLTAQLSRALRAAILDGRIARDEALPGSRALARTLGVSRGTVVTAYEQLLGEGYLSAHPRRGTVAALELPADAGAGPAAGTDRPASGPVPEIWADLAPGHPSTRGLADPAWKAAWREAAAQAGNAWMPPAAGTPELRAAIAGHLRRARGLDCGPDDVVVTAGTSDALLLLALALKPADRPLRIAVEDPGYAAARRVLRTAGAHVQPVPATADGMDPDLLRALDPVPDAVLATPSHQYPLGGRMGVQARVDMLAWAAGHGTVVIEDDYDSEFRHARQPLPAMASLGAAGTTVLVGSFSKTLTPWLRCGYLVATGPAGEAVRRTRTALDSPVSGVQQQALAHYIDSGALARHTARTRREYAHRRSLVLAKLGKLPGVALGALDGGLHATVRFDQPAAPVIEAAAREGILVAALADYAAAGEPANGLVIGYGAPTDLALSRALGRIAELIAGAGEG
ncbi:MocR-like pyridoxine biosynthesis transcription factor PdxR [Arthrobacter ginkgonis]